jgi:hypothetical protein
MQQPDGSEACGFTLSGAARATTYHRNEFLNSLAWQQPGYDCRADQSFVYTDSKRLKNDRYFRSASRRSSVETFSPWSH